MTQASHTPGPWMPDESSGICNVTGSHGRSICSTGGYQNNAEDVRNVRAENEANAARIVACVNACEGINPEAVPDMLAALEGTVDCLEYIQRLEKETIAPILGWGVRASWIHAARAAIAKARGDA